MSIGTLEGGSPRGGYDVSAALDEYDRDHAHPWNRGLHLVGIPLIASSIPVAFVSIPGAAGLFALGWGAQFAGHAIEGKKPSFTRDRRFMAIGALWYVRTVRRLFSRSASAPDAPDVADQAPRGDERSSSS